MMMPQMTVVVGATRSKDELRYEIMQWILPYQ